ncbi:MAG TPA: hypothetical protein VN909_01830 [Candidatus Dormibacteraeota bacterium]|nr:hypothetical protein [Candidatus Dormibacteraeota bacterium]
MLAFLFSSTSGYVALVLVALTIGLPYYFRRRGIPMRGHFVVGYAILALVWAHALVAMSAGFASRTSVVGLDIGTAALLLVTIQAGLGQTLRQARAKRRGLTRLHFAVMLGIVAFAVIHVALNGALVRVILPI